MPDDPNDNVALSDIEILAAPKPPVTETSQLIVPELLYPAGMLTVSV